jgi:hypothetical protein
MTTAFFNHKTILILIAVILIICCGPVQAQTGRSGSSARDIAREIQRQDREQMLLRSPLASKNSDSARLAIVKKIKDDFRALQSINNKMMAEVWESDQIDYGHTSEMISHVREKAVSLKSNLYLPSDGDDKKVESPNTIANLKDLRASLLVLDKFVMSFVNNPVFQQFEVMDVSQAKQASHDLDAVIMLSADLKKHALRLSNETKKTH